MRFFGQKSRFARPAFQLGFLSFLLAAATPAVFGQTAPYVLPYTMSTYAGPHAAYTVGQPCANGIGVALDSAGDGCVASAISVNVDPHDLRVDGQGNVFFLDNSSATGVVRKISPYNQLTTIYSGNLLGQKTCASPTGVGDGCPSTDGAANSSPGFTAAFKAPRGLSVATNGDVFIADYNSEAVHRIAASTGLLNIVTGTYGTAGYFDGVANKSSASKLRGVSADAFGNVYFADTADNVLRVVYNGSGTIPPVYAYTGAGPAVPVTPVAGNTYTVTAQNPPTVVKQNVSGIPAITALLDAPEDVQIDTNGNIYIADSSNNIVRVIYMGKGTVPGVPAPVLFNIYTVAGCSAPCVPVAYPKNNPEPTLPATSVAIGDRKISLDNRNNLYINDSSSTSNVVWFVDNATDNIRVLVGNYGAAASTPAPGCPASAGNTIGDGCPGSLASINAQSTNNGFGSMPDNQGNLYISDPQGSAAGAARIRKLLSGLNFPAATAGTPATQTIEMHFGPLDAPAAAAPYTVTGNGDFTVTPNGLCTLNTDTTTDCLLTAVFTPSAAGNETAILTVKSLLGASSSFELTGTGITASLALDPGNVALLNSSINNAQGLVLDGAGNAYVADTANNRVLKVTTAGAATVVAGTGTAGYTGDGAAATAATLRAPRAVTLDAAGTLYIADTGNNVIRRIDASGIISTFAGGATASTICNQAINSRGDGCPSRQAIFNAPAGLAADNFGQVFVADTGNNVIRQITSSNNTLNTLNNVTTIAGGAATVCATNTDTQGDGCSGAQATFSSPTGLAYDATGQNLFVADTGNNIVRKIYLSNTINPATTPTTVFFNPVTLVAGNGQAGKSIDAGANATKSQLNGPTGVAVDGAGNAYIADTGNSAIRLVTANSGIITTIAGILGSSGTGSTSGSAINVQLASPAAVGVLYGGKLTILDSGNNRILTDNRSQVSYDFGRTNVTFSSPVQNFTEVNTGIAATKALVFTPSGNTTQFTLTSVANSAGTIAACGTALAAGAICNVQGQFTPAGTGNLSATYTENNTGVPASAAPPSITLIGLGAVLTKTTSTVAQTTPATGNSQFGGSVTLTATVTPASCNTSAPSCSPTGTVTFVIDGTAAASVPLAASGTASQTQQGLSVGNHTVSCNYSGDAFYAASTCGNITIIVSQASTTSLLAVSQNNQPQFTPVTLTSTTISNTTGIPTGTVNFFANGNLVGTAPINSSNGTASLTLQRVFNINQQTGVSDGTVKSDNTLPPGTYTLTCTYSGAANYAPSNCAGVPFTVTAQAQDFSLAARGCALTFLIPAGAQVPNLGFACNGTSIPAVPTVAVAQGSTVDATIFITASDTLSGTAKFSCTGLPANSTCTFAPTSLVFTPSTTTVPPQAVDVTLWTDLQPGAVTASSRPASFRDAGNRIAFATLFGWPALLLGFAGVLGFRRKAGRLRGLALLALVLAMGGSSLVLSGCGSGGPGAYQPNLTPPGTYPITISVTIGSITHTTLVNWTVTAPGIPGQQ